MLQQRHIKRRFFLCAIILGLLASTGGLGQERKHSAETIRPAPRKDAWWVKRHDSFLERAKQGNVDALFLGDSITQGWEGKGKEVWQERYTPLHATNFGIGGDRTQHVLWRIEDGKELEGIHPKAIVLMIGTNNMSSDSAFDIAQGIAAIVEELGRRLPEAHVLLLGVFPRSAKATDPVRDKIKNVNERIAILDDGRHVHYLDIGAKFLDEDGTLRPEIMPDYLHLSEKGYKICADAIEDALNKFLKG